MKQGRDLPDAEVVHRCRCGEVEAFRLLVERYQDRVYGLAYRLLGGADDALDAAQETFLRAYGALDRFDAARRFAPWLLRIAANTCYGMLRKRPSGEFSLEGFRERAYYLWERREGSAWWDADANWLEAERSVSRI